MQNNILPTKPGQICIKVNRLQDENPLEIYIITEDVSVCNNDSIIYVVSITDLQRNIANPLLAARKPVKKSDLRFVAKDLKSCVESWNVRP